MDYWKRIIISFACLCSIYTSLKLKQLRCACVVKAYVLLIGIRPFDNEGKADGSVVIYNMSRLMPAPGFSFTLLCLRFITHTLQHNTYLLSFLTSPRTYMYISRGEKQRMGYVLAGIRSKSGV